MQNDSTEDGLIVVRAVDSWQEFREAVETYRPGLNRSGANTLFRGHSSAGWELLTTLERKVPNEMSIYEYSRQALRSANEIASHSGRKWDILTGDDLSDFAIHNANDSFPSLPSYPYMVYLRQHGFSSPLLDWTESPLIAAFFAFCSSEALDEDVAVFAYNQGAVRSGRVGQPMIHQQGPFVDTHQRHFVQQAWYTICTRWVEGRGHVLCRHEDALAESDADQDMLVKITIPASEKGSALEFFKDANINHFTLFQTEDALVKSLDVRAFDMA